MAWAPVCDSCRRHRGRGISRVSRWARTQSSHLGWNFFFLGLRYRCVRGITSPAVDNYAKRPIGESRTAFADDSHQAYQSRTSSMSCRWADEAPAEFLRGGGTGRAGRHRPNPQPSEKKAGRAGRRERTKGNRMPPGYVFSIQQASSPLFPLVCATCILEGREEGGGGGVWEDCARTQTLSRPCVVLYRCCKREGGRREGNATTPTKTRPRKPSEMRPEKTSDRGHLKGRNLVIFRQPACLPAISRSV